VNQPGTFGPQAATNPRLTDGTHQASAPVQANNRVVIAAV
jgi:hypothetical protein